MKILTADFVLPMIGDPIEDGAVGIIGNGIAAVGTREELAADFAEADIEGFGKAAILPGFVNCHSHLEITALRGLLDSVEHDFYTWLMALTKKRSELSEHDILTAAVAGAAEGAAAGVTCFGDIGRLGAAGLGALKTVGLRGVVYQETEFSPDNSTASDDLEKLIEKVAKLSSQSSELIDIGISPHSPYTVSGSLFGKIAEYALVNGIKVSIHASESAAEDELLRVGTGSFAGIYSKFGVTWESPLCSPLEYLDHTGILATKPLLAHCITVSENDIRIISQTGSKIAHCPRSNAKFGHGYAPFESFVDSGIPVGLGSDSVASNNACDMLAEASFAALTARNRPCRSRFISAREALEAATLGGARALGLDDKIGSLEVGKDADIAVVSLDRMGQQPTNDVFNGLIFSSNAGDVAMTMVAGREVYRDGKPANVDESDLSRSMDRIAEQLRNNSTVRKSAS